MKQDTEGEALKRGLFFGYDIGRKDGDKSIEVIGERLPDGAFKILSIRELAPTPGEKEAP